MNSTQTQVSSPKGEGSPKTTKLGNRTTQGCYRIPLFAPACRPATMIRPHTRPSRNRRTAEVDHRGSGTDFVWKNIGFRASAISQKRISCETSFKTPSATPPPAPLAMPFALRERSYSCKSQWNSIGNSSTSTTCNPIYIAGTILQLQITMALFPSLTLPLTNSFPDILKVTINSVPN